MKAQYSEKYFERWLRYLSFVLLAVLVYFMFYKPIEIGDAWWHLSVGRWIIDHKSFANYDIFSPIAEPSQWILTQSIGSCIYYAVYLFGDFHGLKIFRLIMFCFIIGLFLLRGFKKIPPGLLLFLSFLLCFPLASRSFLRPLVFNFLMIQFYLIILFLNEKNVHSKMIFFLPILSVFWFNLHLGSFIYGSALIGIFLLAAAVRYMNVKLKLTPDMGDLRDLRTSAIKLLAVFAGHLFAFFANPFGSSGATYPYKAIFDNDFIINKHLTSNILELLPPAYIFSFRGIWVYFLILLTLWCIFNNKQKNITHVFLFSFSLFLFLYTHRACVFFALCCAYIIIDAFKGASANYSRLKLDDTPAKRALIYFIICLFLSAFILHHYNLMIYRDDQLTRKTRLLFDPYTPQKHLAVMKRNDLTGNVFNMSTYGGYLIFNGYPEIKPFTDSRQANPQLYEQNMSILKNPSRNWLEAEQKYNFRIALLDGTVQNQHKLLKYLMNSPKWQILSISGSSLLFVKSDTFNLPENLLNYEQSLNALNTKPLSVTITPHSESTGFISQFKDFISPSIYYNKKLEEGIVLLMHGYPIAGLSKIAQINDQIEDKRAQFYLSLAIQHVNSIASQSR